ncbi:MAG: MarR family winged helix-turn-helix transcriptional regulator [Solirubrobacteraceae bacterium]|jgi:DNA-binding MarR family transcriptional regulator
MTVQTPHSPPTAAVAEDVPLLASLLTDTLRSLRTLAEASPPPIALRAAKQRGSLSKRHLPALLTVTLTGPLSVSELAARLGHGLSTTSTLVGELSRAGLLERSEDDSDRRRTIVRLDDEHRDAITAWAREALAPLRRTLERLTPEQREAFIDGLRILHDETMLAIERQQPQT